MGQIRTGTLGALLILGSVALGFLLGRGRSDPPQTASPHPPEPGDEGQRQQLREQQRAFEGMLSYNAAVAYGMADGLGTAGEVL